MVIGCFAYAGGLQVYSTISFFRVTKNHRLRKQNIGTTPECPPFLSFSELPYSVIFPLPVWISSPGCQRRPELTRHRTVHVRQQPTGATGQWIKKKAQPEAKKSRRHNLRTILHLCNPTCAQLPRCLCSPAAPTPPCQ